MSRSDRRSLVVKALARAACVCVPPLLVAQVLFAAPPKKVPPTTPKKPPAWLKAKDAGSDVALDATPKETGPKEAKFDAKPSSSSTNDPYAIEVKESERKEGDASVKVFQFGETEIEGRSRWPAVTYFIRRMRAEFEAQKLPHRSFFPELEATKGDPAVK